MKVVAVMIFLMFMFTGFTRVPECNNPQRFYNSVNKDSIMELNRKPIAYYLIHPDIDQYAKLYYLGKFAASDDTLTFAFLDSVFTRNEDTKPFYLFVFNSVLSLSDGALSEVVSENCWSYFERFPCEFLSISDNKLYSKNYCKWFDFATDGYYYEEESNETASARLDKFEEIITTLCPDYLNEFLRMKGRVDQLWKENLNK